MKYFIDTEFIEAFSKPLFGKKRHYIDLISIGIIAEDGREYYAVSNEFSVKDVWRKWDELECCYPSDICTQKLMGGCSGYIKNFWLRNNVLLPIWKELRAREIKANYHSALIEPFSISTLKNLIKWHGKSNRVIAREIKEFCLGNVKKVNKDHSVTVTIQGKPEFWGYYCDYDWTLLCSLFGRMIDLPDAFPMYCNDLKQSYEVANKYGKWYWSSDKDLKNDILYPKQKNEHNALGDARWNKELYTFLSIVASHAL